MGFLRVCMVQHTKDDSKITVGVCYRVDTAAAEEIVDLHNVINIESETETLIMGD